MGMRWREAQKRGCVCILMADSLCCAAEASTDVKRLYSNNTIQQKAKRLYQYW